VWRDIADMNPLDSDNKLVTYHSWFACSLIDPQADSDLGAEWGCPPVASSLSAP